MRLRRFASVFLVLLVVATLSACVGKSKGPADFLRDAIARTQRLERQYVYTEKTAERTLEERTLEVECFVEDDVRYSAKISVNKALATEEKVLDDTLAIRYIDAVQLELLVAQKPNAPAATVVALRSGAWVLDRKGAPASLGWPTSAKQEEKIKDPVLESLKVLSFVDAAMREAAAVVVLNTDLVAYRPDEDPFPVPTKDSHIIRYDLVRPDLPKPGDTQTANAPVPSANHFRKMSVYVKDGLIVEVREVIDVESRLQEMARIYGVKFPPKRRPSELAKIAIDSVNAIRKGQGLELIEVRSLIVKLEQLGNKVTVQMPESFIEGDLATIR